jgi:ornithine carbamoyltransferase
MPETLINQSERVLNLRNLQGRSLLEILDFSREETRSLIDETVENKASGYNAQDHRGKLLALLFTNNSTRTRVSMFKAAAELGITPFELDAKTSQISRGEPVEDTCGVFDQMLDALAIRTSNHNIIEQFRDNSESTVIFNALSDWEHPLQALADLQTIFETFGTLEGLKVAFCGEFNNVARSLLLICLSQGISVSIACPNIDQLDEVTRIKAERLALENNCTFVITKDANEAVEGAHVVYTDVWFSMGKDVEERDELIKIYQPYQVKSELLALADQDAIVLHCLPAHRGEEITPEMMRLHRNSIMKQAGNRKHTFKTALDYTLRN